MHPRTGRCSNKLLPKEALWNGVKTLGYPDQKVETMHEIKKEGRARWIEVHHYLAAVNERFQVLRGQDPGWLDGYNE